jgi:glycosyltransferase involved in cell wall biosynthesis
MSEKQPYLSVIIPAYTEEHRIGHTLSVICDYLEQQPFTAEVLVVLDGPADRTIDEVRSFAASHPHVRWINREENRGKGFTVRQGMLSACGEVRLFTDADNSTDISHFDLMKPLFDAGSDVVICSRDRKDAPGARQAVPQPALKRFLGNAGNLFIQLMAVRGIWDTQCGFKAFSAEAARKIFSVATIDRWGFDIEVLALSRYFGYAIQIIPANWIDDAQTHVSMRNYLDTIWETVRVRWNLLTGAYRRAALVIEQQL